MDVGLLWNLSSGGTVPSVSVEPGDCKRSRLRSSRCEKCVEICPADAIALDGGPRITEDCLKCGLCVAACPTGAFLNFPETEHHLVSLTQTLHAEPIPYGKDDTLTIRCHFARRRRKPVITVSCLGVIGEFSIVSAAVSGFKNIRLERGDCARCRLRTGSVLVNKSLYKTKMLLNDLGLPGVSLRLESRHREDVINRRQFLTSLASKPRIPSAPYIKPTEYSDAASQSSGPAGHRLAELPDKRHLLIKLVSEQLSRGNSSDAPLSWWKLKTDAKRCSVCGVCAKVCPRDAISDNKCGGHQLIKLDVAACTNCGLCIEACPEDAISFGEPVYVSDCIEQKWERLAESKLASCAVCGDTIEAGSNELCPTCDKRQVSVVY